MKQPTEPGQPCSVIGGRSEENGEGQGPNHGRKVITVRRYQELAGGTDVVWRCRAVGDKPLVTYHGGFGQEADFLARWLQVTEPPPPEQLTRVREKELQDE